MEHIVWDFLYTEELRADMKAVSSRFEPVLRNLESANTTLSAMTGQKQTGLLRDAMVDVIEVRRKLSLIQEDIDGYQKAIAHVDSIFHAVEKKIICLFDENSGGVGTIHDLKSTTVAPSFIASTASLNARLDVAISPAWLMQAADEEFNIFSL